MSKEKTTTKSVNTKLDLGWWEALDRAAKETRKSRYALVQRAVEELLTRMGYVPEGVDQASLASLQASPGEASGFPQGSPREPSRLPQGKPQGSLGEALGKPGNHTHTEEKREERKRGDRLGKSGILKTDAEGVANGSLPIPELTPKLRADLTECLDRADKTWLRGNLVRILSGGGVTKKNEDLVREAFGVLAQFARRQPRSWVQGSTTKPEHYEALRRAVAEGRIPLRPEVGRLGPRPVRPFPTEPSEDSEGGAA